jgi:hypothetical protein
MCWDLTLGVFRSRVKGCPAAQTPWLKCSGAGIELPLSTALTQVQPTS